MPPKSEEQFENIRQERKSLILEKAMLLFVKNGLQGTSMSMLAKELGISKGLIYNYFTNKEEILVEVISLGMRRMIEFYEMGTAEIDDVFMIKMVDKTFEMIEKSPEFWSLYFAIVMLPDVRDIAMKLTDKETQSYNSKFAEYFTKKGCKDPLSEAIFLSSIFDGISLNYLYNSSYYSKDYARKRILEILKIN